MVKVTLVLLFIALIYTIALGYLSLPALTNHFITVAYFHSKIFHGPHLNLLLNGNFQVNFKKKRSSRQNPLNLCELSDGHHKANGQYISPTEYPITQAPLWPTTKCSYERWPTPALDSVKRVNKKFF